MLNLPGLCEFVNAVREYIDLVNPTGLVLNQTLVSKVSLDRLITCLNFHFFISKKCKMIVFTSVFL